MVVTTKQKVHMAASMMLATMPPDYLDSVIDSMPKAKANFNKPEDRADCRIEGKAAKRRRRQAERNKK